MLSCVKYESVFALLVPPLLLICYLSRLQMMSVCLTAKEAVFKVFFGILSKYVN